MSLADLQSARILFDAGYYRRCANSAYYAAYHALTGLCVERGDVFAHGWNNPSHEQLPDLIQNNGDLPVSSRRQISPLLTFLRSIREDADYRPGRTVDKDTALRCIRFAATILSLAGVQEDSS